MTRDDTGFYEEPLLIEWIANRLGFGSLANVLPGDLYPPYLLVASGLVLDYIVVDSYNYFISGRSSVVEDPMSIVIALGIILAVGSIRWMRDAYGEAVSDLRISERENENLSTDDGLFTPIIPFQYKLLAYGLGAALLYGNLFVLLGLSTVIAIEGVVATVLLNLLVIPLVYAPLIVEFALLYFGLHFLLPQRIAQADLDLFYYDPRNMGGFATVGRLLKRSYYLFTAGLMLYFTLIYATVIFPDIIPTPYPEPGPIVAIAFSVLWLVGLTSIVYSMSRIHRVMKRKKEEKIRELEDEIRVILDDPYDINTAHITDPDKREEIQHRINQVKSTREYPSTFTMWSQIALSVLLPQALNLAVQAVP